MLVFVCGPLGIIAGLVVGVIVGICTKRAGFAGFLTAQGLSILIVGAIAGFLTGIIYLGSDKPPKIDGKRLTLDFELRVPASVKIPEQPDGFAIRVSLYANNRDNRFAFIDWNSIVRQPDQITIPGHADLMTHSANRSLMASVGNEPSGTQFLEVKFPPRRVRKTRIGPNGRSQHNTEISAPCPKRKDSRFATACASSTNCSGGL